MVQVRADLARSGELIHDDAAVKPEYVLSVTGDVDARSERDVNPKLATGEVEVDVIRLEGLNGCRQPLPFPVSDESQTAQVNEELRIKFRYLDLRRPRMQQMLRLRHEAITRMREYLN